MESSAMMCHKYPVTNDHDNLERTVNICNENIHHYLILIFLRIHTITFITKTFAFLKKDRGFNERL